MKTTLQKLFAVGLFTFILSLIALLSSAQPHDVQTFTTSGSWVCPYGVTSITVETWGGGGAGGAAFNGSPVGGGGGGGSYKITTLVSVTFGTTYNYVVGAGGLGNNTGAGATGIASSFNGLHTANPGAGGTSDGSIAVSGTGGIGGTHSGGNGGIGTVTTPVSGGGGGGAGSTGSGGNGGTPTAGTGGASNGGAGGLGVTAEGDGIDGITIGGGGSGALKTKNGNGTFKGGNGARGQVRITYTINCTAPPAQPTGLVLSPGSNGISGSFTSAAHTDGYIVIRTSTAAAPTSPVNGTTYTAGTFALGGFVESVGTPTTFNSTSLAATTQYWYWVYGYDNVACAGGIQYLIISPLTGNSTTIICGSSTNTATVTSTAG